MKHQIIQTLLLCLLCALPLHAQRKNEEITLHLNNATLSEFIQKLETATGFNFIYGEGVKADHPISINVTKQSLKSVMDIALSGQPIRYEIQKPHILLMPKRESLAIPSASRGKATISGFVSDLSSGETLIGANVYDGLSRHGAASNAYGFYTLTLPKGEVALLFSYMGYEAQQHAFTLQGDTVLNIQMNSHNELAEVVVTSHRREAGITATHMGAVEIPLKQIQNTPTILGEADLLKTIQLLPGVQAGTEGFSGLYVRGGSSEQNLVLLDGTPIYNPDHLLGIFSIFQPEAVKNVTLYKSSFPARYGGRLSSVVDVRTNDGNLHEHHGLLSIGMTSDKLHWEGPIVRGRTAFSLSARGTHSLLFTPFVKSLRESNAYFYDTHAKLTHQLNERNRLYLSLYHGKDSYHYDWEENYQIGADSKDTYHNTSLGKWGLNWQNSVASLRWNHVYGHKLFGNATITYNSYGMNMRAQANEEIHTEGQTSSYRYASDYRSGIRDLSARMDFDYTPLPTHQVRFGAEYIAHQFRPETIDSKLKEAENGEQVTDTLFHNSGSSRLTGHEVAVFAEDDFKATHRLSLNVGVHASYFYTQHKGYFSLQPRLSAKYLLQHDVSLKASYSQMSQYVHLLSSTQIVMPTDLWVPITKDIKPMAAHQWSAGIYYTGLKGWEFALEGYIKQMNHVLEYKEGMSMGFYSAHWESRVEMGKGRSRGLEIMAQKTEGKTTGWISYTLSNTERRFEHINEGEWFPYRYDRRHSLNVMLNHQFSKKFDVGVSWIYHTGGVITVPERTMLVMRPGDYYPSREQYISHRGNYRLPATHRLNLSMNLRREKNGHESIWNLSLYNAYNAMNPNLVYASTSTEYENDYGFTHARQKTHVKKVTILPIIPSVSYTYKF